MFDETEVALIASLLEDDYFLHKVLEHLIDYGLHECRLVCRKWREASQRLSVELTLRNHGSSVEVLDLFPKAKRITLRGGWMNEGFIEEVSLCEHILHKSKGSSSLQSFSTAMRMSVLLSEFVPSRKAVFEKLRSLTMGAWFDDHAAGDQLISSLQQLTLLTRLEIHGRVQNWIQPASRLKNLQHLVADISLIVNEQYQHLCFPALTQLTHLAVLSVEMNQNLWRKGEFLKVLRPYEGTLRSLSLAVSLGFGEVNGISHLTEFQRLQSLALYLKGELYDEFFAIRRFLVQLTELRLGAPSLRSTLLATIFSLTNLRTLTLSDIRTTDDRLYNLPFSRLAHLKELCIKRANIGDHWTPAPSLTRLHIEGRRGSAKREPRGVFFSSRNFSNLTELEDFTIQDYHVEEDLFLKLAELPKLVNLRVGPLCGLELPEVWPQVNGLTRLERLTSALENSERLVVVLKEGKLIRLRYLEFLTLRVAKRDIDSLFKAFSCLRVINSSRKA